VWPVKKLWPVFAVALFTAGFLIVRQFDIHPLFRPNAVHWTATLILFLYLWGMWEKLKNRDVRKHARLMAVGMTLDLGLTFYHEVGLRALSRALGLESHPFEGNRDLLRFHICDSTTLVAIYLFVWITGRALVPVLWHWFPRLRTMRPMWRTKWVRAHAWLGYTTVTLNALSWASSPYFLLELAVAQS
jgi:hypothetical protein